MADTRKILKVFLASPGDLKEERRAAKAAVDEINSLVANPFGYHVELVGWEETVSRFGRPQALINAELDHCVCGLIQYCEAYNNGATLAVPCGAPIMEAHQCSALAHWEAFQAACSASKSCW
jgi:hypothetical protein